MIVIFYDIFVCVVDVCEREMFSPSLDWVRLEFFFLFVVSRLGLRTHGKPLLNGGHSFPCKVICRRIEKSDSREGRWWMNQPQVFEFSGYDVSCYAAAAA